MINFCKVVVISLVIGLILGPVLVAVCDAARALLF